MASYNAINGVPNNINLFLLTDILKQQWGFAGFVVSDLGGVNTMVHGHLRQRVGLAEAVAQSLNAGCDFSDKEFRDYIPAAVRGGLLSESRLDDALYRVLRDRFRLGEFDPPDMVPFSGISPGVIASPEHRDLALQVARESIVLLKNKGDLLPLDKSKLKRIAVIGPHADIFTPGGYSGKADRPVNPRQGLQNRVASQTALLYAEGCGITNADDPSASIQKAADLARQADVAIVYVGTTLAIESEGRDRVSLALPGRQEKLIEAVYAANPKTIVVLLNAGPLAIPWVKEHVPAILETWWGGVEGGDAIADVIFGAYNPAGRLPLTVYASESQVPPQDEYDVTKGFTYMYLQGRPLFAFGHGLSYTRFTYGEMTLSAHRIAPDGEITARIKVTNSRRLAGDEVVQLYLHEVKPCVKRPVEELRGFQRVHLNPGESATVTLSVPGKNLAFYDEAIHGFRVNPGPFEILIGAASDDIRSRRKFEVISSDARRGAPLSMR